MLRNGDHVRIDIDRGGATIRRLPSPKAQALILFEANFELVSRRCAELFSAEAAPAATPLSIPIAVVSQLGSAAEVRRAFAAAVASLG